MKTICTHLAAAALLMGASHATAAAENIDISQLERGDSSQLERGESIDSSQLERGESVDASQLTSTATGDTIVNRSLTLEGEPAAKKPSAFKEWARKIRVNGALSTEFLIPMEDKAIATESYDKHVLNNTYFDLTINAPYISIGGRYEWAKWPLPGYEKEFSGWGVPYLWATGSYKWAQLTVGDFYQQFGSGLILRTYEERSLGVDNAIRGGRLILHPAPGLQLIALGGKQRRYWEHNPAWLWGADAEWSLGESFTSLFGKGYGMTLGFSYVGKNEKDEEVKTPDLSYRLNLPRNVAAFDGRVKLRLQNFNILAEAAWKNNDPTLDNNYIYSPGHAELLSVSYSSKGFSAFVQAKRSDNMSYRSKRSVEGISSFINHMPAFTLTQTYALAAMYPYATQPDGEWAFQGEVRYLFKRKTPLGGKYGTQVRLTGSYISGLDRPRIAEYPPEMGSDGYGTPYWKIGGLNYADVNLEINKKLSKRVQLTFFYMFQKYNQKVVEGEGERGDMVNSNIFIVEGQWKINRRNQLRWEVQYLTTKQDKGDWLAGVLEFSIAPQWMFSVSDTYNVGVTKLNYYDARVTFNYRANRFQLAFGRTRAGYNCSGGVCRYVPASKGFTFIYNFTF